MSWIPCWEDEKGNRFFVLAQNHVFDDKDAAQEYQLRRFLDYALYGWITSGQVEIPLDDGKGEFPHVEADGPFQSKLALIGGPEFDKVAKEAAHA